jgi:hypothetical protein
LVFTLALVHGVIAGGVHTAADAAGGKDATVSNLEQADLKDWCLRFCHLNFVRSAGYPFRSPTSKMLAKLWVVPVCTVAHGVF